MAETATYSITLTTNFDEWERYNLFMMGSCRSDDGADKGFIHLISRGNTNSNTFTRRRVEGSIS